MVSVPNVGNYLTSLHHRARGAGPYGARALTPSSERMIDRIAACSLKWITHYFIFQDSPVSTR